ncbi:uncharacterized protein BDR25DRAFT_357673 [Lindgomyces ingoldianus]|uniref:Uncharacterized protein n=1 Tax=Lindgomyces ingoldianus TaxID=673940 RepID=A0ACB6QPA5_9PLEO|nr:uncharacterized protein BDR25DRAFT_357673 [Lindgomyces ingoldianus]KAF2468355.1 hypothetical protein BDR25DRAFT_357673 [Lindgomyces ingoldianus]
MGHNRVGCGVVLAKPRREGVNKPSTQRGLTAEPLCALGPPVNTGSTQRRQYRPHNQKPTACVATQRRLLISSLPC